MVPATPATIRRVGLALALTGLAEACAPAAPGTAPQPTAPTVALAEAESAYADLYALRDRIAITIGAGAAASPEGVPLSTLTRRRDSLRIRLEPRLAAIDSMALTGEDQRALGEMRHALATSLAPDPTPSTAVDSGPPVCVYDARTLAAGQRGVAALRNRMYACYGWARNHLLLDGKPTDARETFDALTREEDQARRRRLFLALEPVWRAVDGKGGADSPYRTALRLDPKDGELPASGAARALGIPPDSLEAWLRRILETWRAGTADTLIEPWDWYYVVGRANRRLGTLIPRPRLDSLNTSVFRALGADPVALHVHYDLAPREGKDPVASTDFGARARRIDGRWTPAEPWVVATYETGGLDNLNELLHETGHAVHIAAIRTRPAFSDWPDSDPFTEGLGDFVALDVFEPAWQLRWLGDSVPLADGLRARYAGIVFDIAWALFETRMQRDPTQDPNLVWAGITGEYFRIRAHPELSWWAMRGQLVNAPGYMMNYAIGAIVVAAIRARTTEVHGPFVTGDSTWYGWIGPRLYRWGLERSSRQVVTEFLGGPVTPAAILADMRRMRP